MFSSEFTHIAEQQQARINAPTDQLVIEMQVSCDLKVRVPEFSEEFAGRDMSTPVDESPSSANLVKKIEPTSTNRDSRKIISVQLVPFKETLVASDALFYRLRYISCAVACLEGMDCILKPVDEGQLSNAERTIAQSAMRTTEIRSFLVASYHARKENPLLELPVDFDLMIARLSWYSNLRDAWCGGWLRGSWRAWMTDIACQEELFPKNIRGEIQKLYGSQSAQPGSSDSTYGSTLERDMPDLFSYFESNRLHRRSSEVFVGFSVA